MHGNYSYWTTQLSFPQEKHSTDMFSDVPMADQLTGKIMLYLQ